MTKAERNRIFGRVARECFKETSGGSMHTYGSCMSTELRKAYGGRRRKKKSKR